MDLLDKLLEAVSFYFKEDTVSPIISFQKNKFSGKTSIEMCLMRHENYSEKYTTCKISAGTLEEAILLLSKSFLEHEFVENKHQSPIDILKKEILFK